METKALVTSKTAWVNTAYTAISPIIVSWLVGFGFSAEEAAGATVGVLGGLNLVLRKISTATISGIFKKAPVA